MPSPTVAELQEELDRMRNIIGQYRQMEIETAELLLKSNTLVNTLQLRIEEMDRENVLRSPLNTPFSRANTSTDTPTCHDVSGAIEWNKSANND